jgi:phosphopantetheinyl transferase (holo-ACP synthase)
VIYGVGTDIIQIDRVRGVMERTRGRFVEKILGPREMKIYLARKARSENAAWHSCARVSRPRRHSQRPSAWGCAGR